MLSTLSSLWHLFTGLTLIAMLIVGIIAAIELYLSIFQTFVTSVSDRILESLYRIVLLAAIGYSLIAFLAALIGGDINAR